MVAGSKDYKLSNGSDRTAAAGSIGETFSSNMETVINDISVSPEFKEMTQANVEILEIDTQFAVGQGGVKKVANTNKKVAGEVEQRAQG